MTEDPKPEKKKCCSLKNIFNRAAQDIKQLKNIHWKDWKGIGLATLKDLRRPSEIFMLVASVVVLPGGLLAYPLYRVVKYQHQQAANDVKKEPQKLPEIKRPPAL